MKKIKQFKRGVTCNKRKFTTDDIYKYWIGNHLNLSDTNHFGAQSTNKQVFQSEQLNQAFVAYQQNDG